MASSDWFGACFSARCESARKALYETISLRPIDRLRQGFAGCDVIPMPNAPNARLAEKSGDKMGDEAPRDILAFVRLAPVAFVIRTNSAAVPLSDFVVIIREFRSGIPAAPAGPVRPLLFEACSFGGQPLQRGRHLSFYNVRRPNSSRDRRTPNHVYFNPRLLAAA